MERKEIIAFSTLVLCLFVTALPYFLMSGFYPTYVEARGVSRSFVGFVFGVADYVATAGVLVLGQLFASYPTLFSRR